LWKPRSVRPNELPFKEPANTINNTCIANIINHIYHDDQGIHEINHRRQFIEKNESDCIIFNKEELYNLGALMLYKLLPGSSKNLLYFDKLHSLPNEGKRYVISPLKLN